MLRTRLMFGIPLMAGFLLILTLDSFIVPWFPLWFATMVIVMTLAASEVAAMLRNTSIPPPTDLVIGGVLAVVVSNWVPHIVPSAASEVESLGSGFETLAWPLWTFVAVMMTTFLVQSLRLQGRGEAVSSIAGTLFAVAYLGLLGSFMIQTRWVEGRYGGVVPLGALVITAKGSDTGAYLVGKLIGKRPLWPSLSPKKTIEGAIGGFFFGILGALLVFGIADTANAIKVNQSINWLHAIGFGLTVGTAALLGDLMESMIKRDSEQKDASSTIPGFGGILDVIDSVLFAGPVAYGYLMISGS